MEDDLKFVLQAARHSVRVEGDVIIGDILSDPR